MRHRLREIFGQVVLLSLLTFMHTQRVPVPLMVDVILQIKKELRAECLYVFYNAGDATEDKLMYKNISEVLYLAKLLYQNQIQVAIMSQYEPYHRTCNTPLYVVLSMDITTHMWSNKVPVPSICKNSRKWLVFLDGDTDIKKLFSHVYIPLNCEFLIAKTISEVEISLFEIYHITATQSLQIEMWKEGIGLYARRSDLEGALIRATAIDGIAIKVYHEPKGITIDGYVGQVWKCLKNHLNFSDVILAPPESTYGNLKSGGNWTGMMGMITRNEAHVGVADIVMNPNRISVIDFIAPLLNQKSIMIININNQHIKWNSFLQPFSYFLWTAVAIAIIFTTFCLRAVDFIRYHYGEVPCYTWQESVLLLIFGSFCLQGHPSTPQSLPCRMVCFLIYSTSAVIGAAYSSYLISYLTLYSPSLPFNTFREFLDDGSYMLSVMTNTAHLNYFKNSSDTLMKIIYTDKIAPYEDNLPQSMQDGVCRVCDESFYAFMVPDFILLEMVPHLQCHVTVVPQAFIPGTFAMAISKNSPYLELLRISNHKMHNMGILKRIQSHTLKLKLPQKHSTLKSFNMREVAPLLLLITSGVVIAIFIMVLEKIFKLMTALNKLSIN